MTLWSPMGTRGQYDTAGPHGTQGTDNRSVWLGLTAPNAIGMSRLFSHVLLKHGGCGLSFKWKLTALLIQASMAKTGFCLQNSQYPGIAPKEKVPLPTSLAGLVFPGAGSHLPSNTGAQCYLSYGKELSLLNRHPWTNLVFSSKIPYTQGLIPDKSCQDRQVWLALASGGCL